MHNMGIHPDTRVVGIDDCGEIALSVRDNYVVEDPNVTLLHEGLEKRTPSLIGSVSARMIQVSEELIKNLPSFSRRHQVGPLDHTKKSTASHALKGFRFVSKNDSLEEWPVASKRFDELSKDSLLHRSKFGECIGLIRKKTEKLSDSGHVQYVDDSRYFSERLFDSLCRRWEITSESITKPQLKEFWEFWNTIGDQSFDSRLRTFFDMVDKDGDGRITIDEVKEIISLSASDNNLSNIQEKVDEYAALIMEELKEDIHDYITIESLETLFFQEPTHNATGGQNLSQMLSQNLKTDNHGPTITRRLKILKYLLHRNWKRCWVVLLWIGIMAGLFTWKYIEYKHRAVYHVMGSCVCIAKGAAETLKLNMAIVLLPVCRNTVTWLRNKTKFGVVVPFDDNINFHQVIAVAIAIGVGLHAISHLACDFPRLIHATEEEYRPMQQYFGDQAQNYWHFMKEVEVYTGIIMIVLMTIAFALAWLRNGVKLPSFSNKLTFNPFKNSMLFGAIGTKLSEFVTFLNRLTGFNVFWYSHHFFVIVYALLIVHGVKLYLTKEWYKKTTWMYIAVPVLLYTCERLTRTFRSRLNPTSLRKVVAYPGNVLALHMTKPQGFNYQSGQYIFIKDAAVSPFEWHPFSITSAPGDDYLSVHIKGLGDWTRKINENFRDKKKYSLKEGSNKYSHDFKEEDEDIPEVRIDGPYGAPAADYKNYNVVMLVGLGIGATPMISIVKNILNNLKAKEVGENANNFKTTHVYFYWVTPEQGSFDWFRSVMNEVAEMDKNGVIEMHCYCTSVYKEGDARSAFISMLQKVGYAKKGVDVVSDTRFMSHFGRPDWKNVYERIAGNHKGSEIGVFCCGKPQHIQDVKQSASDFSIKTSTKFEFHKENF